MNRYFTGIKAFLLALACVWMVSGCEKSSGVDPNPDPDPDPTPNPPSVGDCRECDYYPVCNNSWFTYLDSFFISPPVLYTDTLKQEADTTISGLVYKKVKRISSKYPSTEYLNCTNGVYRLGGKYGFGLKPIIILKPNEPVGTSWTEAASTGASVTITIEGKGLTLRVNNRDYTDVIREKFSISGSGSVYTAYYYFARGVGIIKFEYGGWNFDPAWFHRNYQQSYFIP